MSNPTRHDAQLLTVEQIANMCSDTVNNVQSYVRRDAIPYVVIPDGIVIPLMGFQACMNELYDLDFHEMWGSQDPGSR